MTRMRVLAILSLFGGACDSSDASRSDAGSDLDASGALDAGSDLDASIALDAGSGIDAAVVDASLQDGGTLDASTEHRLVVQLTGVGTVAIDDVDFLEPTILCMPGSDVCTIPLALGTQRTLTASSPSAFAGWGGACAGSTGSCTLTVNGQTEVTAIFAPEPSGVWSLVLPDASSEMAVAFDAEGSLYLATSSRLIKLTSSGEIAWTTDLPAGILQLGGLDVSRTGNVYLMALSGAGSQVLRYDASGAAGWTRTVGDGLCGQGLSDCLVVTKDDTIASISTGPSLLTVHRESGDMLWSESLAREPRAIDARSNGDILAAVLLSDLQSAEVLVFSALGAPLAGLAPRISNDKVSLAVGPDDSVLVSSSAHSHVSVAWLSPDEPLAGAVVRSPVHTDHAVAVDSEGRPVTLHTDYPGEAPGTLRVLTAHGSMVFERSSSVGDWIALQPLALASGGQKRFALAGRFTVRSSAMTWIGMYEIE